MPMFRLKSATVEARQFLASDGAGEAIMLASWCNGKPVDNSTPQRTIQFIDQDDIIHFAVDGDWIIKCDGEFSRLSDRAFSAKYEPIP